MKVSLRNENRLRQDGFELVAGCDEAGRAPLAGPVVCAAVILPPKLRANGINDSKLLTADKRDSLHTYILKKALAYKIVSIDCSVIDRINIFQASLLGMKLAVENLELRPDYVLVDGNCKIPDLGLPQEALIKGDQKSLSIAAASILAKVARDRIMTALHNFYPEYNFKQNKGYPTVFHRQAIALHGTTKYHRRSFKIVAQANGLQEKLAFE
jgi:ribonuclease HII